MTSLPTDQYIPTSNDDLVRHFSTYVEKWVARYNKVPSVQEDLVQHVWERLISGKVVDKYLASRYTVPQKFTGPQVASLLGMNYEEWVSKMWRGQDPNHWSPVWDSSQDLRTQSNTVHCEKCGSNMTLFRDSLNLLRQHQQTTKDRELTALGLCPRTSVWWGQSNLRVICTFCAPRLYGEGLQLSPLKGVPWWSAGAYFHKSEVESVLGGPIEWETEGKARSAFKGYLALTVGNCVKNWFRTKSRRHREQVMDPDPVTGRTWEEDLESGGPTPEVLVDLQRALVGMQGKGRAGRNQLVLKMNQARL